MWSLRHSLPGLPEGLGLLAGLLFLAPVPLVVQADSPAVVGEAYAQGTKKVLYRELHWLDSDVRRVSYELPDGVEMAHKRLEYGEDRLRPSLQQSNWLNGRHIRVRSNSDGIQLSFRAAQHEPLQVTNVPLADRPVVDAGFDEFVRSHWQQLRDGEAQTFSFLVLSRQRWVSLTMDRIRCRERAESRHLPGSDINQVLQGHLCLRVVARNPLLRWVLDPIALEYLDGRLLRFSGLGNLTDRNGDSMKVDIVYRYPGFDVGGRPAYSLY